MPEKVRRVRREKRVRAVTDDESFHLFRHRLKPEQIALVVAGLAIGIVIGIVSFHYGSSFYNNWREGQLLKRANTLLEQHDYNGAIRSARETLEINRDSLPAFQVLASATEQQNKIETITWRAQIARLLPDKLDSQLNLASAALRFGELDTARKAMENVAPGDRNKAAYHVVAGWLARAQGDQVGLEEHFAAAARQEPNNDVYQYNLAVLQIKSADDEIAKHARATLERLIKSPDFHTGAVRALLNDAVDHNQMTQADTLAQDLQMSGQVTFADLLLCLNFYKKLDEKKFYALLERVKPVAMKNPVDLALLLDWMNENGMSGEVLKWQEKLPADLTTHPPPSISIAEAFAEAKNWSRLKRWTRGGSWDEFDYLRLGYQAYAARQSRQSGAEAEFNSLWRSAEKNTSDEPQREQRLARLATKWNLNVEAEQLWLRVSKNVPMRREALDALARIYRANNDLPNLYRTMQRLYETSPGDATTASSYARLALLLEQNAAEGHRVAREAYERNATDVSCAVTYAFSLYGQGRTAEGIEVLKKIPPDQLHESHTAVYAAALFLDENQPDAAKGYIDAAKHGPLYSEEKKLLEEAVSKSALAETSPAPSASSLPGHGAPASRALVSPSPSPSSPATTPSPAPTSSTSAGASPQE